MMRSLPEESLISLIFDSIFRSNRMIYLYKINKKTNRITILVSPSKEDKVILLNAITIALNKVFDNKEVLNIVKSISEIYNDSHIKYIESDDINFYDVFISSGESLGLEKLSFLSEPCLERIDNALKNNIPLNNTDSILFKIQMFIYASVWLDMDDYLEYLYYLYK